MNHYNETFRHIYKDLLDCNINREEISKIISDQEIESELETYHVSIVNNTNYIPVSSSVSTLEYWREPYHPHLFPLLINHYCGSLNCKDICELGAGVGNISKCLKHGYPVCNLTAIEANETNFRLLQNNLINTPMVLEPYGLADIKTLRLSGHNLSSIPDKSFDMVYTCTVLMHIPYLPQLAVICEIARISSKYVMHVENTVAATAIGDMKNHYLNTRTTDYPAVYSLLGFKTIRNDIRPYPDSKDHNVRIFIAERI
jgi:phospholipid N-methyltransferase